MTNNPVSDSRSLFRRIVGAVTLMAVASVATVLFYDYPGEDPIPEGVVLTTVRSAILGQERELIIHLPPNPDSAAKYPVVYVLDGSSQDDHIANKFDVLSAAGLTPKVIVVGIPNMTAENRSLQLIPPFMRTDAEKQESPKGEGDKFLSFMESELFPFIETNYPASQIRLFCGNSRGGLLVMYSLLHDPEMFQARFCYSAPFWREDSIMVKKVSEFLSSRDSLRTFLSISVGQDEGEKGFYRMTEAIKGLAPKGFTWYAELTPHANHQNNAHLSASLAIARWGEYVASPN